MAGEVLLQAQGDQQVETRTCSTQDAALSPSPAGSPVDRQQSSRVSHYNSPCPLSTYRQQTILLEEPDCQHPGEDSNQAVLPTLDLLQKRQNCNLSSEEAPLCLSSTSTIPTGLGSSSSDSALQNCGAVLHLNPLTSKENPTPVFLAIDTSAFNSCPALPTADLPVLCVSTESVPKTILPPAVWEKELLHPTTARQPPQKELLELSNTTTNRQPPQKELFDLTDSTISKQLPQKELLDHSHLVESSTSLSPKAVDLGNLLLTLFYVSSHTDWCWEFCSNLTYKEVLLQPATNYVPLVISNHQNPADPSTTSLTEAVKKSAELCLPHQAKLQHLHTAGCSTYPNHGPTISLVASKTKLAKKQPKKKTDMEKPEDEKSDSIHRLELCAALLLAKLISKLGKLMNISPDHWTAWSDSSTVLAWLDGNSRSHPIYVANRVKQTLELTTPNTWHYVPTLNYPADCASRGLSPTALYHHTLWWEGPPWLKEEPIIIPKQPPRKPLPDARPPVNTLLPYFSIAEEVSNLPYQYPNLTAIAAWCLRFFHRIQKGRPVPDKRTRRLTGEERHAAEKWLLKEAQKRSFQKDINLLRKKKPLGRDSRLRALNPYHWPIGRVIKTISGNDNLVRVVIIKTAAGTLQRAVTQLALIYRPWRRARSRARTAAAPPREPVQARVTGCLNIASNT